MGSNPGPTGPSRGELQHESTPCSPCVDDVVSSYYQHSLSMSYQLMGPLMSQQSKGMIMASTAAYKTTEIGTEPAPPEGIAT